MLEKELTEALKKMPVGPNMIGVPLLVTSGLLALFAALWMLNDQTAVKESLDELWRK